MAERQPRQGVKLCGVGNRGFAVLGAFSGCYTCCFIVDPQVPVDVRSRWKGNMVVTSAVEEGGGGGLMGFPCLALVPEATRSRQQ